MSTKSDWKGSITLRLVIVGFLVLILLIPARLISGLVDERRERREKAVEEVAGKWAGSQTVGGPVLTVPYTVTVTDAEGQSGQATAYLQALPEKLEFEVDLRPRIKHRGIYRVVLYNARVTCRGRFDLAGLAGRLGLQSGAIRWAEAFTSLYIPDMRGLREEIALDWNGDVFRFEPGVRDGNNIFRTGVSTGSPVTPGGDGGGQYDFSFALDLNGSDNLSFLPLGRVTTVKAASSWPSPSFDGSFLPESSRVGQKGFTASWRVLEMNRDYPQQWTGSGPGDVNDSRFGVSLFSPVDAYTRTARAVKYVIMFIGLTFLVFFLVEVLHRRRIHPVQYLLVGMALCLFYVLLLSLTEHIGFTPAYLLASVSVVGLIAFYVAGALGGRAAVWSTTGTLAALYGFMYVLLCNEDYALLLGSVGLFAIMAAVMYLTRRVDWYGLEGRRRPRAEEPAQAGEAGTESMQA